MFSTYCPKTAMIDLNYFSRYDMKYGVCYFQSLHGFYLAWGKLIILCMALVLAIFEYKKVAKWLA